MNERLAAENGKISAEAVDRRLRSETILRAEGVALLAALPVIETTAEALKRFIAVVALRTLCLLFVAAKGEGLEEEVVERGLQLCVHSAHLILIEISCGH